MPYMAGILNPNHDGHPRRMCVLLMFIVSDRDFKVKCEVNRDLIITKYTFWC